MPPQNWVQKLMQDKTTSISAVSQLSRPNTTRPSSSHPGSHSMSSWPLSSASSPSNLAANSPKSLLQLYCC